MKNLNELLSQPDLTKDNQHIIGIIVEKIKQSLESTYHIVPIINSGNPIVSLEDNYYNLGYKNNEITLSHRYTRYIDEKTILRTQMSSVIPSILSSHKSKIDTIYMCPGKVYRRDVKDKTHVGEPHQMDVWCITTQKKKSEDLLNLVSIIISVIEKAKNEKIKWRYIETQHNYTDNGIEVEIYYNNQWLEILECGLVAQSLLDKYNLSTYGGLALGLGLDRLAMIIKDISDIRILLSDDIRIKQQLNSLKKYKEVSTQPSIKRDLSIATDQDTLIEELTEKILSLDYLQNKIESVALLSETSYDDLPLIAIQRLGLISQQKNMLIRITLRDLTQSISNEDANDMYKNIYELIHQGTSGYQITNKK